MKLFVLNSKPFDPNGYIFQSLIRALCRRHDLNLQVIRSDELRKIPIDPHNQSLLIYGGEELNKIPREYIQRPFGRRAIWFTEDPYETNRNKESATLFQVVFTNDTGSLNNYQRAFHLPLAADSDLIPRFSQFSPQKLMFFSGTAWPNRKVLLSTLLDHWSNTNVFDLHLVANPFVEQQISRKGLHQLLRFEEPIAISEFSLRAANSLCTLVVGRDFSGSGQHTYARSPGPRLFEAGITGSCQLVHASEIPDMPDGLEEGRHYLRFRSTDQLLDLLRQAQSNPEPFRVIGRSLSAEIQSQHTYDQRAAVVVDSLLQCDPEVAFSTDPLPKSRALFISHEQTRPGFQHGGAGLCLDEIVSATPDDVDLRILCRTGDDGHSFMILDRHGGRVGGFRCRKKVDEFSLHHPEFEDRIQSLLTEWQPQLVHINHFLGFTPAILPLARNAGARTSITLHDYYTICDSWNLLDSQHEYCGINNFFDERCQSCCANRRAHFRAVDPIRRRVNMAEALAHAHVVIFPSLSAKQKVCELMPHLSFTKVIEPVVPQSHCKVNAGDGADLIVLIPGNLAVNKGYLELRRIIEQSNDLGLSIKFRVLGRVEGWIQNELDKIENVDLLGSYDKSSFFRKAEGTDLALFLSPWPETYCITFDEWKCTGRPCFYYSMGALAEAHRQHGLHHASASFSAKDRDGIVNALIEASTPRGLQQLREPSNSIQPLSNTNNFGLQHWSLFSQLMISSMDAPSIRWPRCTHQPWVDDHEDKALFTPRQRLKSLIYRAPGCHKLAALWRRLSCH